MKFDLTGLAEDELSWVRNSSVIKEYESCDVTSNQSTHPGPDRRVG